MPVIKLEWTTVRSPRGRLVHALALLGSSRTMCDRPIAGWRIATRDTVSCDGCKLAILRHLHGYRR